MEMAHPKMVGDYNKAKLLSLLRDSGPMSRVELSRKLALSAPAVTNNIAALLQVGMIYEVGTYETEMGRKPVLLEFNEHFRYVVGIDIGALSVRSALADLRGNIITQVEKTSIGMKAHEVADQILDSIVELMQSAELDESNIIAVAVGSPGINNSKTGTNILAPFIEDWDEIDLKAEIEAKFHTRTIISNDVDMDLIGEQWKGAGRDYREVVYVKLGDGLAARMTSNGNLFEGVNQAAGEIGYMVTQLPLERIHFNRYGQAESELCNHAVVQRYLELGGQATVGNIVDLLMLNNDEVAKTVIADLLERLTAVLINTIAVLDPKIVILGGAASQLRKQHLQVIVDKLACYLPFVPDIITSETGRMSGVFGTVRAALSIADEELNKLW